MVPKPLEVSEKIMGECFFLSFISNSFMVFHFRVGIFEQVKVLS